MFLTTMHDIAGLRELVKTFWISLYVGEFEYLNRQREEAALRLQTSRTTESELQRQSANVQTNGLNHAIINAQLAEARDETMRFQARVNDLELSCNDKKRAIREHIRRFDRNCGLYSNFCN
ncbi:hypothetical protein RHMOL_Rhmol08G0257900 [Rhododendron molle]|uniref:Uncharacterized protein n=1 Tax=Rhododendron molle TaxID=49168 RepID=A0ACC0MT78_RHOML|nr:hypothetical protein RHMOL_Rhmol08G0257900 [Rhododendron molle]